MNTLKKIIEGYLSGPRKKILITDYKTSFNGGVFSDLVYSYVNTLNKLWSNNPNLNRGVAIKVSRNADYLAIIFASWIAEGYYLPLNVTSPKKALETQIIESEISVLAEENNKSNKIDFKMQANIKKSVSNVTDARDINFDNAAYVIFTSGSTGAKKGVVISKLALITYMKTIKDTFSGKFIAKSLAINGELTFDITLADIVFGLIFNTEICITSEASNLLSLCAIVKKRQVESIYAVPTTWELFFELESKVPDLCVSGLKNIFSGGEALTFSLLNKMRERCPSAKIFNMYGPTEFTINALYFEIPDKEFLLSKTSAIPIGRPLPGVKTHISENIPNSNKGELFLAGGQMMDGYINAKDPCLVFENNRYYPTGDLVYKDENNLINFIGRMRDYEKVSGYRINIAAIEQDVSDFIDETCKLVVIDSKIYYIIKIKEKSNQESIIEKITTYVDSNLEQYEKPTKTIFMDAFPLNSNGKLDRQLIINLIHS